MQYIHNCNYPIALKYGSYMVKFRAFKGKYNQIMVNNYKYGQAK